MHRGNPPVSRIQSISASASDRVVKSQVVLCRFVVAFRRFLSVFVAFGRFSNRAKTLHPPRSQPLIAIATWSIPPLQHFSPLPPKPRSKHPRRYECPPPAKRAFAAFLLLLD